MDSLFNVVEAFEINQPMHIVTFGKAFGRIRFVLIHATNEVVGHADVKRTSDAISKYVNVVTACSHQPSLEYLYGAWSRVFVVRSLRSSPCSTEAGISSSRPQGGWPAGRSDGQGWPQAI